jgi:hypothetical protein
VHMQRDRLMNPWWWCLVAMLRLRFESRVDVQRRVK